MNKRKSRPAATVSSAPTPAAVFPKTNRVDRVLASARDEIDSVAERTRHRIEKAPEKAPVVVLSSSPPFLCSLNGLLSRFLTSRRLPNVWKTKSYHDICGCINLIR